MKEFIKNQFFSNNSKPTISIQVIQLIIDFTIAIVFLIVPLIFEFSEFSPNLRGFYRNDQTILYPHLGSETIPTFYLIIYTIFAFLLLFFFEVIKNLKKFRSIKGAKESIFRILYTLLSFSYSISLLFLINIFVKLYAGRLRPDFLARCKPDFTGINPDINYFVTEEICKGDKSKIIEGRKSFFSGHSSISMFCVIFILKLVIIYNIIFRRYKFSIFIFLEGNYSNFIIYFCTFFWDFKVIR
jgi:phosphatidate phosphatase